MKSGRTLSDLAKDPKAPHWISNRPESSTKARESAKPAAAKLPSDVHTMLATAVDEPFDDKNWLFELKWDGYRALATIARDGTLSLVSRNGTISPQSFPSSRNSPTRSRSGR